MDTEETASHSAPSGDQGKFGSLCPRIVRPFSDCYCINMTSRKIALAIEFCGAGYENCEIYKRNKPSETRS
jgi:hypothetical protein